MIYDIASLLRWHGSSTVGLRRRTQEFHRTCGLLACAPTHLRAETNDAHQTKNCSPISRQRVTRAATMDHARVEAGHEQRYAAVFDAASLLKEFFDTTRPLAAERNLFLKATRGGLVGCRSANAC